MTMTMDAPIEIDANLERGVPSSDFGVHDDHVVALQCKAKRMIRIASDLFHLLNAHFSFARSAVTIDTILTGHINCIGER